MNIIVLYFPHLNFINCFNFSFTIHIILAAEIKMRHDKKKKANANEERKSVQGVIFLHINTIICDIAVLRAYIYAHITASLPINIVLLGITIHDFVHTCFNLQFMQFIEREYLFFYKMARFKNNQNF